MNTSQKLTYYSLYALALFLYISMSLTALHHILLVIPAVVLSATYFKKKVFFVSKSHLFLLLLILWSIFATLLSLDEPGNHLKNLFKLKYLLIPYLGIFAVSSLFNKIDNQKMITILKVFLISATLASLVGLIAHFTGVQLLKFKIGLYQRASGVYGMVMSYAYSISIFCSALFALIIHNKKEKKIFDLKIMIFLFTINVVGLYFSYTRGALLSFLVAVPFIFIITNKKLFWGGLVIGILLASTVIGISLSKKSVNFYRMNIKESDTQRVTVYKTALLVAKNNLFKGIGYRNFENRCGHYRNKFKVQGSFCGHAHNNYLEQLTTTGVIGLLLFLLFIGSWSLELFRASNIIALATLPAIANFLFSGLFQNTFTDGEICFLIMGLYMVTSSLIHRKKLVNNI